MQNACEQGDLGQVIELYRSGVPIDFSCLETAVSYGHTGLAMWLSDELKFPPTLDMLHTAIWGHNHDMMLWIYESRGVLSRYAMYVAAYVGNYKAALWLYRLGVPVSQHCINAARANGHDRVAYTLNTLRV